jgi:hypothetical protein
MLKAGAVLLLTKEAAVNELSAGCGSAGDARRQRLGSALIHGDVSEGRQRQ